MEYSVIVPFYDNRRILDLCLSQVYATMPSVNYEVLVVVDNPLHEGMDTTRHPRVRVITPGRNLGYSGAANLGAYEARGSNLVFMDADIIPQKGWFEALVRVKLREARVGAVGGKILSLSRGSLAYFGLAFHEIDVMRPFQHNEPSVAFACHDRAFQAIPSGLLLISRDAFFGAGGFDERLFNAYPDLDLSLSLREEGWTTWVAADAVVFHRGGVSGDVRMAMHADAKALFFRKWGGRLGKDALPILELAAREYRARSGVRHPPGLAVNFSASLFSRDYLDTVTAGLGMDTVDRYELPNRDRTPRNLRLEERLSWDLNRTRLPILYFVDDFTVLEDNYYWFHHRTSRGDVVADRHGNVLGVMEIDALRRTRVSMTGNPIHHEDPPDSTVR
jgi:GT2 family glycosyltransferase